MATQYRKRARGPFMIMEEAAEVLYENLEKLYGNFNHIMVSLPKKEGVDITLPLAKQIESCLERTHSRSGLSAEERIRSITDVFRNAAELYFPNHIGILFMGYEKGPKIKETGNEVGTYAYEPNVRRFCHRTEPCILGEIEKERARMHPEEAAS